MLYAFWRGRRGEGTRRRGSVRERDGDGRVRRDCEESVEDVWSVAMGW